MSMDCDTQGSTTAMRLDWPGEGWIQRILRHVCVPGDFPSLEYVSVDVRSFTALNVDLAGMFDTVSRMLIEMDVITPSDLVQFLTSAESEVGFNPRDDLLELLTGEFVFIVDDVDPSEALPIPGADAVNYALIVGLGDGVAFTTLVDGVIRKLGFHVGRKSEEFQGFQVYQVPMPIMTLSLGYAVLDDMAVLSLSPTMLRDVLRRKASADLPGITGSERYHEAVARVRAGYGMIGFSDTASDMKSMLRTLSNLDEYVDEDTDEDSPLRWLARLLLPDEALVDDYFTGGTASVCTIDESGVYFESAGP
jgi:hypothetical protein